MIEVCINSLKISTSEPIKLVFMVITVVPEMKLSYEKGNLRNKFVNKQC